MIFGDEEVFGDEESAYDVWHAHYHQFDSDLGPDEETEEEDDDGEAARDAILERQELEDFEQADEYFGYFGGDE